MRKTAFIAACAVALTWVLTACTSLPQAGPSALLEQEAPQATVVIAHNPWSESSGAIITAKGASDLTGKASTESSKASKASKASTPSWSHFPFPGKVATTYRYAHEDGRAAMLAQSTASSSMLRREMSLSPEALGLVNFAWKVPELISNCDVAVPEYDDSPVRILFTFEGDRTKFSAKNAVLSELAQLIMGEPLPYATLVYVWSNHHPRESVIISPRTDRVRSIVVESGHKHLGQWQDYERHIRADFEKAYGEAPGALLRIAIMTDSDNTRSQASAWYGALSFKTDLLQN